MADKRRKTMVDLREFPAALELARTLYRDNKGHLRQDIECREIADLLGLSNIAVWHAYHRGDLGVPSPNPARAEAWAKGQLSYEAADKPCRRCSGTLRRPGDDFCVNCEAKYRDAAKAARLANEQ
jgi:hypothetical protein